MAIKVNQANTRFFILCGFIYMASVIIYITVPFIKITLTESVNTAFTLFAQIIYSLLIIYLMSILKFKCEKKAIIISFIVYIGAILVLSIITISVSFHEIITLLPFTLISLIAVFNVVIQSFRVKDKMIAIPFKLYGITLLLKLFSQSGLASFFGYFDIFPLNFRYVNLIASVIGLTVPLTVMVIFYKILAELKDMQNPLTKAALEYNYNPEQVD